MLELAQLGFVVVGFQPMMTLVSTTALEPTAHLSALLALTRARTLVLLFLVVHLAPVDSVFWLQHWKLQLMMAARLHWWTFVLVLTTAVFE